jgi:hypothetical protein
MNTLPNDISRCNGMEWDECETCLRRIAPRNGNESMIAPPPIVAFECENLITDDYPPKKWEPKTLDK